MQVCAIWRPSDYERRPVDRGYLTSLASRDSEFHRERQPGYMRDAAASVSYLSRSSKRPDAVGVARDPDPWF